MAESLLPPLTCDACGRALPREERGRWVTVVRTPTDVALLCPACRQAECDAERARQIDDARPSDRPRKGWF